MTKSVDSRRTRRQRYIQAIDPFRKQFNCTAAEVHGVISGVLSDNISKKAKIEHLSAALMGVQAEVTYVLENFEKLETSKIKDQLEEIVNRNY